MKESVDAAPGYRNGGRFMRHSSPGNVRELENMIKRILRKGHMLDGATNSHDRRATKETRTAALSPKDIFGLPESGRARRGDGA